MTISVEELNFTKIEKIPDVLKNPKSKFEIIFNPENLKLWWPYGYGEQNLYNLTIAVELDEIMLKKSKTIGFRSIELVEEPVSDKPENGLSFYFKINNVSVFLKGSNWIPVDSFQELIDETRLKNLLESATLANMNVLRIWGGGLYEKEEFYKLTNQLGILIWHDFMFACSVI